MDNMTKNGVYPGIKGSSNIKNQMYLSYLK